MLQDALWQLSNIYAMPEQIGDAGLFFNPNSSQEIADVIYKLWTDDALVKELINKGIQKVNNGDKNNLI